MARVFSLNPPGTAPASPVTHTDVQDSLRRAEAEIAALQRELEARSHEACEAKRQERVWRDTCAAHARALEAQRDDLRDISSNATRQYRVRAAPAALPPEWCGDPRAWCGDLSLKVTDCFVPV